MKPIPDIEQFKTKLRNRDLRATNQRLAVHRAMIEIGHASADSVWEWLQQNGETGITVASIYNILSQLADAGIYRRLLSSNNKMYFDVNPSKHIHVYDKVNNEFKDLMDDELTSLVESHFQRRRFRGYKIEDINIQIVCRPTKKQAS